MFQRPTRLAHARTSVLSSVFLVLLVLAAGCSRGQPEIPPVRAVARVTPAPAWNASRPLSGVSSAELASYVSRLQFDTTTGSSDDQRLMLIDAGGNRRYGPRARVEPEMGAAMVSPADMAEGRILARVRIIDPDFDGSVAYPKLGIVERVSYIFVRQAPDGWYAMMMGEKGTSRVRLTVHNGRHGRTYPTVAVARWLWSDSDEGVWMPCGVNCCQIQTL